MNKDYVISGLVIVVLFLWLSIGSKNSEIEDLKATNSEISNKLDNYIDALYRANENIELANDRIGDAKGNAWGPYDDMGYALDELEPVDTIR